MSSWSSADSAASSSYSFSKEQSENDERQTRNWLDLPGDMTAAMLLKLGAVEILTSAQSICTSWRIPMNLGDLHDMPYDLEIMCHHAVPMYGGPKRNPCASSGQRNQKKTLAFLSSRQVKKKSETLAT
ncbi:hypothetical protein QN277_001873 [Acacia crassicarpa]|uniref:Uncharacterized protein n=1 Tax=Acacia crassicarpa TaxID=499986 RepID=A0AAE1N982_9FABA|nr:hypothetical protein QN277_001873 [Acacia crassicarpa]